MRGTRGAVKAIPRISAQRWQELVARDDVGREPLVVTGAFGSTDAVKNWTPEHIAQRFADHRVVVSVDLPMTGSPYEKMLKRHQRSMTVAEFFEYLPGHPGSYLAQAPMAAFPGLADELSISRAVVAPTRTQSLWVGNATRSGLHFDLADGLLAQVYGVKTATLVRAGQFASLYPFPDVHTKSRIDPDDIDDQAFPRFTRVDRFTATLTPGDALFIPRLWWHHLVSEGVGISANAWFGRPVAGVWPATILRAGPAVWRQIVHDFVALGLLKRDFQQRVFSAKPTGLQLYEILSGLFRH
jgi:lysine-specific demethylase 8